MSAPQFDPATYAAQLAEKAARLEELLAPFDAPAAEVFDSPASITACVPSSACGAKTASAITRCSSRATSTRRS